MKRLRLILLLVALVLFTSVSSFSQTRKWVTAYHPTWWYGAYSPSMIDYSSITHLVIFGAQDAKTTSPYFNTGGADGSDLALIVSLAHAKGCKVIFSAVGGYGQTGMPAVAANATMCQAFVTNVCAWAKGKGFDGIELDWEFPRSSDKVGWNRLIRLFRIELDKWNPRGDLMTSMWYNCSGPNSGPYMLDSMMVFDQINPMSYTMWMGAGSGPYHAGFDTPVNLPTQFSGYVGYSLSQPRSGGPLSYIDAGYPAEKIGVSVSFEGTRFNGVSTMGPQYSSWAFTSSVTRTLPSSYAAIPTTGRKWDDVAKAAWCQPGGSTVYSYQDTNSVRAISSFAKQNNLGGVMIYDIGCGYDVSLPVPDIMLKTIYKVLNTPLSVEDDNTAVVVKEYKLEQNYPNPFNPTTTITFELKQSAHTTLKIYDILGKEIATLVDGQLTNGRYNYTFDGSHLASGTYFYRLQSGEFSQVKRMAIVK